MFLIQYEFIIYLMFLSCFQQVHNICCNIRSSQNKSWIDNSSRNISYFYTAHLEGHYLRDGKLSKTFNFMLQMLIFVARRSLKSNFTVPWHYWWSITRRFQLMLQTIGINWVFDEFGDCGAVPVSGWFRIIVNDWWSVLTDVLDSRYEILEWMVCWAHGRAARFPRKMVSSYYFLFVWI